LAAGVTVSSVEPRDLLCREGHVGVLAIPHRKLARRETVMRQAVLVGRIPIADLGVIGPGGRGELVRRRVWPALPTISPGRSRTRREQLLEVHRILLPLQTQ